MGCQGRRAGSLGTSHVGRMRAAEARVCQGQLPAERSGAAISQGTPLHAVGRLWIVSAASLVGWRDARGTWVAIIFSAVAAPHVGASAQATSNLP